MAKSNPIPSISLDDIAAGTGGFKIIGENTLDLAGYSVSGVGDVNGDGLDDVVVGAYRNDTGGTDAGAAYVVFGQEGGLGTVNLDDVAAGTGGFQITGENAGDFIGASVGSLAAGDINGDGIDDVIIGAAFENTGGTYAGATYVVFGEKKGAFSTVNLDDVAAGTGGFKIIGENVDDRSGVSVAAGDINKDNVDDLIIGAPRNDAGGANSGAAYVVFGEKKDAFDTVNLDDVAAGIGGLKIIGENAGDQAGVGLAGAGDLDGDGSADVIVGAAGSDAGGDRAGAAYAVFGADFAKSTDFDGDFVL
jgi:hypothetical protein